MALDIATSFQKSNMNLIHKLIIFLRYNTNPHPVYLSTVYGNFEKSIFEKILSDNIDTILGTDSQKTYGTVTY